MVFGKNEEWVKIKFLGWCFEKMSKSLVRSYK